MKRASDEYKFNVDINGISSRPIGTDFKGTSYAYRYTKMYSLCPQMYFDLSTMEQKTTLIERMDMMVKGQSLVQWMALGLKMY